MEASLSQTSTGVSRRPAAIYAWLCSVRRVRWLLRNICVKMRRTKLHFLSHYFNVISLSLYGRTTYLQGLLCAFRFKETTIVVVVVVVVVMVVVMMMMTTTAAATTTTTAMLMAMTPRGSVLQTT